MFLLLNKTVKFDVPICNKKSRFNFLSPILFRDL